MKISNGARTALSGAVREAFNGSINIYESGAQETTWEVNWSALGSQPTEVALEFAEGLKLACKVTDWLNRERVQVDYDIKDGFTDREKIGEAAARAAELIKSGRTESAMRSIFNADLGELFL